MNAKSLAPGQSAAAKVAAGETLFPVLTVVRDRALRAEQEWYEGDGRGYTRDFIAVEGQRYCEACKTTHDLKAFPTFSVPRQNGETRGRVCRAQVRKARLVKEAQAAEVAAKAARVERARKAAAASAKARAAKAAARKAATAA